MDRTVDTDESLGDEASWLATEIEQNTLDHACRLWERHVQQTRHDTVRQPCPTLHWISFVGSPSMKRMHESVSLFMHACPSEVQDHLAGRSG